MPGIRSAITAIARFLPDVRRYRPRPYSSPISVDDLTGEYLLLEIPDAPSPETDAAVATLLTGTNRNGLATGLTDCEGYPSLFPPGASLFDADGSSSRLQDVVSAIDRVTHVFRRSGTEVVVINAARIEENVRIAEHDPGRSGEIARRNVEALADCLSALPAEHSTFVDGDAIPADVRDRHLVNFQESVLYR
ncbi:hypothetical protein [Halalkalicoccus tibetensis]|uniref:Uncharacterized protein n=1 Tax=Halalkalicoccus tibetensis TaxID=175632 RepID=A0ABD5V703_9EURY